MLKPRFLRGFKQQSAEGADSPAAGGLGPGGGDLGEFTLGKRWGFLGRVFSVILKSHALTAPLLSTSAQWAGSPVGLAPPNRPTEQRALHIWRAAVSKDLLATDFVTPKWAEGSSRRYPGGPRAAQGGPSAAPEGTAEAPERPRVAKSRQPTLLARSEP